MPSVDPKAINTKSTTKDDMSKLKRQLATNVSSTSVPWSVIESLSREQTSMDVYPTLHKIYRKDIRRTICVVLGPQHPSKTEYPPVRIELTDDQGHLISYLDCMRKIFRIPGTSVGYAGSRRKMPDNPWIFTEYQEEAKTLAYEMATITLDVLRRASI